MMRGYQLKGVDQVALCCYFDRVAQTLTLGESHFGLRPAAKRHTGPEALALACYGVEIRLVDETGLGLCQRLREALPPEFTAPVKPTTVAVAYRVTTVSPPGQSESSEFVIRCDDMAVFATSVDEELFWWLWRDIDQVVARRAPRLLFVHAAVVGWRGVGIVIPGRGTIGKSRLCTELVRCGAVYYSDAFAVLDEQGLLHPYRGMIGRSIEGINQNMRLLREEETAEPLPIGLIVSGAYDADTLWQPAVVRGPHTALTLVDSTVLPREQAAHLPQIVAKAAADAVGLRGARSEAKQVAAMLLDIVDDALVSRALGAAGFNPEGLADDLARIALRRLRSPERRGAPTPRRLIATSYIKKPDLLPPADQQRLQDLLAVEGDRACQAGKLPGELSDALWALIEPWLRALQPLVEKQLEFAWFTPGEVEWQIAAHGRGRASAPRAYAGDSRVSGRCITCVYFFHRLPTRFSGGELRLYDSWLTPAGSAPAGTATTFAPIDNSLLIFPGDALYEIRPVDPAADALADGCFTLTVCYREAAQPAQNNGLPAHADGVGARAALPSPVSQRRTARSAHDRDLVAVVVPVHRFPLSETDQMAIRHLRAHLGQFDRYMIGPPLPPPEFADFARPPSAANEFVDRDTYNTLLMTERFYRAFEQYEYILIYQLDCLVFSNALEEWCRKGFDYIGAPWFERWHDFRTEQADYPHDIVDGFGSVGNGGFSLRKVSAALDVLTSRKRPQYETLARQLLCAPHLHEDIFWSFDAPQLLDEFRVPTPREALRFAFETQPRYCYRENGNRLPFGCHGWYTFDRAFWEPFLLT
jgi:hypothetical protein